MEVTREDVLRCAQLTHLSLEEAEIEPLRQDMTADPQPRPEPGPAGPGGRGALHPRRWTCPCPGAPTSPGPGFTQDQALANAPRADQGYFLVPKVM